MEKETYNLNFRALLRALHNVTGDGTGCPGIDEFYVFVLSFWDGKYPT